MIPINKITDKEQILDIIQKTIKTFKKNDPEQWINKELKMKFLTETVLDLDHIPTIRSYLIMYAGIFMYEKTSEKLLENYTWNEVIRFFSDTDSTNEGTFHARKHFVRNYVFWLKCNENPNLDTRFWENIELKHLSPTNRIARTMFADFEEMSRFFMGICDINNFPDRYAEAMMQVHQMKIAPLIFISCGISIEDAIKITTQDIISLKCNHLTIDNHDYYIPTTFQFILNNLTHLTTYPTFNRYGTISVYEWEENDRFIKRRDLKAKALLKTPTTYHHFFRILADIQDEWKLKGVVGNPFFAKSVTANNLQMNGLFIRLQDKLQDIPLSTIKEKRKVIRELLYDPWVVGKALDGIGTLKTRESQFIKAYLNWERFFEKDTHNLS